jgi:glycosyltransferase involved in cell wall biosynthesis
MRIYKKRIAFLISDQHFHAHGGIGSFAKSFTEMCQRIDWKVDMILDKKPRHTEFAEIIKNAGANIIYSKDYVSYGKHSAFFQNGDTINSDKISNFRDSIIHALQANTYDMFVVNTQEAMTAIYSFSLDEYVPVVFYTHLHSMIYREAQNFTGDVFLPNYHHFFNKHMEFPNAIIGTQSKKNVNELEKYGSKNCVLLRMPMSEQSLLEPYQGEKSGVLFIGRWESGKNPEAYIRAMKESGLLCKVMTSEPSVKKFKKAFKAAGITNFDIKADISGKEKSDFIRSSKVFFMPSLRENYPFAFIECLGHMPTIVLDKQDWSTNFDSKYYITKPLQQVAEEITKLYNNNMDYYQAGALDYIRSLEDNIATEWIEFLAKFEADSRKSNSDIAQLHGIIDQKITIKYNEFFKIDLKRQSINRDDCISYYGNRHKYYTTYTDDSTYLSKDSLFVPEEEDNLFEGL